MNILNVTKKQTKILVCFFILSINISYAFAQDTTEKELPKWLRQNPLRDSHFLKGKFTFGSNFNFGLLYIGGKHISDVWGYHEQLEYFVFRRFSVVGGFCYYTQKDRVFDYFRSRNYGVNFQARYYPNKFKNRLFISSSYYYNEGTSTDQSRYKDGFAQTITFGLGYELFPRKMFGNENKRLSFGLILNFPILIKGSGYLSNTGGGFGAKYHFSK